MQIDPMENWRRLTGHYAQMTDGELLNLAGDFQDLTDTARDVLRDEMKKRGLGDPQAITADDAGPFQDADEEDASPAMTYVWKNLLCECNGREQAQQISEVLRQAGIESWIDASSTYSPYLPVDPSKARMRVMVASDELEEARALIAQPIPADIADRSGAEEEAYEAPMCPSCGAPDPVLEGVDPTNAWRCEACGREWTDSVPEDGEAAAK